MNKHGDLTAMAQCLIEYVEDLLTASPVKNDGELMALLGRYSGSVTISRPVG
jgi:hypothetical protein